MEEERKNTENTENTEINQKKIDRRKTMPHLFKKGQSGNPAGKPKGTVSIVTALKQKLEEVPEGKEKIYLHYFIEQMMKKSVVDGDVQMIRDIIDRVDGKAKEFHDITSGGQPIAIPPQLSSQIAQLKTNLENEI